MDGKMATTETPNLEHNTVVLQLEQYFTHSVEQEYGQMDFSQLPKVIAELRQWQTFKTMDGQVMQRDVLGWMAGILAVVILLGGIGLSIFIFSAIFYKIINLFSMPAAFVQLKGLGAITLGAIIGMTGMMHFMKKGILDKTFDLFERGYNWAFNHFSWFKKTMLIISPLARHEHKKKTIYTVVEQFAQSLANEKLQGAFLNFFKKYRPEIEHPYSPNYELFYQTIFNALKNRDYVVALENVYLFFQFFSSLVKYEKEQNTGDRTRSFSQMNIDDMVATFQQDMSLDDKSRSAWIEAMLRGSL
jgi:hypothetical protein